MEVAPALHFSQAIGRAEAQMRLIRARAINISFNNPIAWT